MSQLCLAYLVFGWESADYFKQHCRIFFLFFEREDLILLKTHSFSQECPWTNTAETITPVGLSDTPLKRVNLLINTNYNFSTGNSASQAQPRLLYYSQSGLPGLKQRETTERDSMQICQTKEEIVLEGLNVGIIIWLGIKCTFLKATLA